MYRPSPLLKERLRAKAAELRAPLDVVEKDYALSYVLWAIYQDAALASCLVFKGGTSLRKAYFPDYRFSVDLDFSAVRSLRSGELDAAVARTATATEGALFQHGPFSVTSGRRKEKAPHPTGQEAFQIRIRFPWQLQPRCVIKVEITTDEPIIHPPRRLSLLHSYAEDLPCDLVCYALEEVVAEKLRTLLQAQKRATEGKWVRNCARDYYDLWYLTSVVARSVDEDAVWKILRQKASVRDVGYTEPTDFFPPAVVTEAERQWRTSLADLVVTLPDFETAITHLKDWIAGSSLEG